MPIIFGDFDVTDFWEPSGRVDESYRDEPLTDDLVREVKSELGFKLPRSYIELMRTQNGGVPRRRCYPMTVRTSWSENHVAISGFAAIGFTADYAILGEIGHYHWLDEWEYPQIGVYFGNTPAAGPDMIALDYRHCGPDGEPRVVHVDVEGDEPEITLVAKDFETFVRGLVERKQIA